MKRHPFNFWFTLGCIVVIGLNSPWWVTTLAVLAAVEWKVSDEAKAKWAEAMQIGRGE